MTIIQLVVPPFSYPKGSKGIMLPYGLWVADVGQIVTIQGNSPLRWVTGCGSEGELEVVVK